MTVIRKMERCCLQLGFFIIFEQRRSGQWLLLCPGAFPVEGLFFDAAGKTAVKLMLKTWVKQADIQGVGACFSVAHAKAELGCWAENLKVSSRGYMQGYEKLKDLALNRFIACWLKSPMILCICRSCG